MTTPDIAGLCERLRNTGLESAAEAADTIERQAAELVEARTLDKGFYEWMIERDLLERGEEVEWGDIVTALTEHEIELTRADERQAAEIERLREALVNIQSEAEREEGRWVHLKRVIAINARAALTGEDAGGKG